MKKYRRSAFTYICYAAAAIFACYALFAMFSILASVNEYRMYGYEYGFFEILGYLIQGSLQPLIYMVVAFMAGLILDEVRKLNPAYYKSDEEIIAAREAKQAAKAQDAAADEAVAEAVAEGAEAVEAAAEAEVEKAAEIVEEDIRDAEI